MAAEADVPRRFAAAWWPSTARRWPPGKDFDASGRLADPDTVVVLDEAEARALAAGLDGRAAHGVRR